MNKRGFLTRISYTDGLLVAGIIVLILSAIQDLLFPLGDVQIPNNHLIKAFSNVEIGGFLVTDLMQNLFLNHLMRFIYLLGSALLLQFLSTEFRLIRVRSNFPFFFFCVFSATIIPSLPMSGVSLSCIFFCWAIIRLFKAFDSSDPHKAIFDASLLITLASVFQIKLLYLMPVIWLMMVLFRVFNLRSFTSSVLGVLSIFWIVGGLSFLFGDYVFIKGMLTGSTSFKLINISEINISELAYMVFLFLLMFSALIYFWPKQHLDKLLTRNYLKSIILLWCSLLSLWVFSGNDLEFLLYLFSMSALVVAHFFSLVDTFISRMLFILFLIMSLIAYLFL